MGAMGTVEVAVVAQEANQVTSFEQSLADFPIVFFGI